MSSHVAEELAKFIRPTPRITHDEDYFNSESNAKVIESLDFVEDIPISFSSIRRKTDLLLHETDPKYAGKKISRHFLEDYDEGSCGCSSDHINNHTSADLTLIGGDVISSFKKLLVPKSLGSSEESMHGSENVESSHSEDEYEFEETEEKDTIEQFSRQNIDNDVDKGHAVKAQLELWFKLCECRIKIQKLLLAANKMPQFDNWKEFKEVSDDAYQKDLNRVWKKIKKLLDCFGDFQIELLKSNVASVEDDAAKKNKLESDEEISSEEFSGSDIEDKKSESWRTDEVPLLHSKSVKRKCSEKYYSNVMTKRHEAFKVYRNSTIQAWDKKTKLTSGHITQKSFNMFDQTAAMDQIIQILSDKQRLVKKTQIKRADHHVLGRSYKSCFFKEENDTVVKIENTIQNRNLAKEKEHDPEIFDDEDFYRQLLKDIIESKSVGIDPIIFGKQLEIQRARSKMKCTVDTKASKGRKIRFDVHPKLVNFMAPIMNTSTTSDSKNELFLSLFGQHKTLPVVT